MPFCLYSQQLKPKFRRHDHGESEILQAEGNVVVTYGNNSIKAETSFLTKKNELRFKERKNFTMENPYDFLLMSWSSEKIFGRPDLAKFIGRNN